MSLIVTVLLIAHAAHHHGERATGRDRNAAGYRREPRYGGAPGAGCKGIALTVIGSALGILLGLVTARYLDAILTSFPGLPAAFSFFVPRRGERWRSRRSSCS